MTQKHIKFKRAQDRKYHRTKTFEINDEPHEERSRRVLLLSSEDVDRMAVESYRARLMMHLVSKPKEISREFGCYFREKKNESNPIYIMTSHTSPLPIQKQIVPAYPTLVQFQDLKWGLSVKGNSENSQTDTEEDDSKYICRCHICKTKHCLGRDLKKENIHRCPKDNIMKFCDNSTMTPKLRDTCCGESSPMNKMPITSKVSMATSRIFDKDESSALPHNCQIIPLPILKKADCKCNVCQNIENNTKHRVTVHEAVKDNGTDIDKVSKYCHVEDSDVPTCPNNSENSSDYDYVRKVIYNEGISDLTKKNTHSRYPITKLPPMKIKSPIKIKRNVSKVSILTNCNNKESIIPYAHRVRSKYHSDCKPSYTKSYYCEIEENNVPRIDSALVFNRTAVSKAIRCTPPIRLPKKVLTSEKDIEAFVDYNRK